MPQGQHAASSPDEEQAFRQSLDAALSRVVVAARETGGTATPVLDTSFLHQEAPLPPLPEVAPAPPPRRAPSSAKVAHLASVRRLLRADMTAPLDADDLAEAPAAAEAPLPPPRHRARRPVWMGASVAALLLLGAFVAWRAPSPEAAPPERIAREGSLDRMPAPAAGNATLAAPQAVPAPAAQAPAPPPTPPLARFEVASDGDASTESQMLAEMTQAVAVEGVALDGAGTSAAPALGIARYDALRAHPGAWRIMAPLNAEEVYALVRADSPLRYLHELRGRRVNGGPAGGARARSADALYRRLFGAALPPAPAATLPRDAALQRLLARRGVDALLFFDGQPSRWLAALPEQDRRQLRLLSLAPGHASTQRALQAYLAASVPALDGGAPVDTLGVLSFLVAADPAADAGRMVQALCARLPALRRSGHPKWGEVQPALQLPAALLPVPQDGAALQACAPSPTLSSTPTPASNKPGA